jgi:hypothetical protein
LADTRGALGGNGLDGAAMLASANTAGEGVVDGKNCLTVGAGDANHFGTVVSCQLLVASKKFWQLATNNWQLFLTVAKDNKTLRAEAMLPGATVIVTRLT